MIHIPLFEVTFQLTHVALMTVTLSVFGGRRCFVLRETLPAFEMTMGYT